MLRLRPINGFSRRNNEEGFWSNVIHSIQAQWGTAKNLTHATGAYMSSVPEIAPDVNTEQELTGANVNN